MSPLWTVLQWLPARKTSLDNLGAVGCMKLKVVTAATYVFI